MDRRGRQSVEVFERGGKNKEMESYRQKDGLGIQDGRKKWQTMQVEVSQSSG